MNIELGDVARDKITGFEGVVVARTIWLNNCDQLQLQPREMKDGKPMTAASFDRPSLILVVRTDLKAIPVTRPAVPVELEDVVQDRITQFVGVVIGRTEWMNGCSRVLVKPRELKDGLPVDASVIDEVDLVVLERAIVKREPATTGGPRPEPMRR